MDVDARVEALEAENARLQDRIDQLEALNGMDWTAPIEFGLTARQSRLLGVMLQREVMTTDAGMAALYRDHGRDEPDEQIIKVQVHKIRHKLKALGLPIITVWGVGYRVEPAVKARIRSWGEPQAEAA